MAAPISCTVFRFSSQNTNIFKLVNRSYKLGERRNPVRVISPEKEKEKLKKSGVKFKDGRTNADIKYVPDDPVQRNINETKTSLSEKKKKKDETFYQSLVSKKPAISGEKKKNAETVYSNLVSEDKTIETNSQSYFTRIEEDELSKKFNQVMVNIKSKKEREKSKEILLEGKRLIIEALKANGIMKALYFSKKEIMDDFPANLVNCPIFKVPHKAFKMWADTETPQGVLAIFEMPPKGETTAERSNLLPLTVICDQIYDPGNMGLLIRTAAAVGCQKFITMKECVDVWDPKVIRSATGAHFRLPIINSLSWEFVSNYFPDNSAVFIADSRRPSELNLERISAGGADVDSEILDLENCEQFIEDDTESKLSIDKSFSSEERLEMYKKIPMQVSLYSEVDYTSQGHTVLIVGGDKKNMSIKARKLAFDNYGQYVMLPMLMGVNRLNTSITGSIMLYEIHKQYSAKTEKKEIIVGETLNNVNGVEKTEEKS